MAAKKKVTGVNMELLKAVALTIASGQVFYISKDEADPLLANAPALIQVNTDANAIKDGKAPAQLTEAGQAMVTASANTPAAATETNFTIITNAVPPASKRGSGLRGGGAPKKYPFDQLEVGGSFFVPADAKHPDPVKTLGSAVSSANMRYAEKTGNTKTVTRTKRGEGNKAILNTDGSKARETKTVDEYKFTRKFQIRPVEAGVAYGTWIAPATGALITRSQ